MRVSTSVRRRRWHDLNHLALALALVSLSLGYSALVVSYFGWDRIMAAQHAWGFLCAMCSPSALLLLLLWPVWYDWRAYRPWVPRAFR